MCAAAAAHEGSGCQRESQACMARLVPGIVMVQHCHGRRSTVKACEAQPIDALPLLDRSLQGGGLRENAAHLLASTVIDTATGLRLNQLSKHC